MKLGDSLALLVVLLVLVLISALPYLGSEAQQEAVTIIEIDPNGFPHVTVVVNVSEGVNEVRLPVAPLAITLTVAVDGTEAASIFDPETRSLIFVAEKSGVAVISYVADVSISNESVVSFNVETNASVKLVIPPGVVLLTPPSVVESIYASNGSITIVFRGPQRIEYIVVSSPPQITSVPAQTPRPSEATAPQPRARQQNVLHYIVAAVALAIVLAVALLLHLRSRKLPPEELDDIDRAIIKALEKRGGSAMQSELQKELAIPKTTLWRHVRRLERAGILRVEKVGQQNRVVLAKKK